MCICGLRYAQKNAQPPLDISNKVGVANSMAEGLEAYLGAIPDVNRHLLNEQPSRPSQIKIARSLGQNWALLVLPNVTGNDITDIRNDHHLSHLQQK